MHILTKIMEDLVVEIIQFFFRNIYHEIENYTENFILPIIELFFVSFILIGVSVFLYI